MQLRMFWPHPRVGLRTAPWCAARSSPSGIESSGENFSPCRWRAIPNSSAHALALSSRHRNVDSISIRPLILQL